MTSIEIDRVLYCIIAYGIFKGLIAAYEDEPPCGFDSKFYKISKQS